MKSKPTFSSLDLCNGQHCPACRDEIAGAQRRAVWAAATSDGAEQLRSPCKPRGLAFGPLPLVLPVLSSTPATQPGPAVTPPMPVPRGQWPWYIDAIAGLAEPPDRGVGDTIERLLGPGGEAFKALAQMAWKSCNCAIRQATLNAKHPYAQLAKGQDRTAFNAASIDI